MALDAPHAIEGPQAVVDGCIVLMISGVTILALFAYVIALIAWIGNLFDFYDWEPTRAAVAKIALRGLGVVLVLVAVLSRQWDEDSISDAAGEAFSRILLTWPVAAAATVVTVLLTCFLRGRPFGYGLRLGNVLLCMVVAALPVLWASTKVVWEEHLPMAGFAGTVAMFGVSAAGALGTLALGFFSVFGFLVNTTHPRAGGVHAFLFGGALIALFLVLERTEPFTIPGYFDEQQITSTMVQPEPGLAGAVALVAAGVLGVFFPSEVDGGG